MDDNPLSKSALAMVRNIPMLPLHRIAFLPSWLTLFMAAFIAIMSVISIVTCLCASDEEIKSQRQRGEGKTDRLVDKQVSGRLQSSISSKYFLLSKMISWKRVSDEREDDEHADNEEEAIWKKTIIRGEKCRPLNFSGKILYDSNGNLLPDSPHPSPRR